MGAGEGTGGNGGDAARNCSQGQYLREQERRSRGDLHVSSGSFTSLCSAPLQGPSQRLAGTAHAWVHFWLKNGSAEQSEPNSLPGLPPRRAVPC